MTDSRRYSGSLVQTTRETLLPGHSCNTSKKDIEVSMWLRRCMAEGLGLHAPSPARMRVLRAIRASTCASWVAELASSALRDMIADLDREREMMGR